MNTNEAVINQFYSSFQKKDYQSMQACYNEKATFSDPVFRNLDAKQVRAMWEMLCKNGKDLSIDFKILSSDKDAITAEWRANYLFSATGKHVTNIITASFLIEEGKIISHRDHFNFHKWASQALGFKGALLGWTSFLKNKVRQQAMKSLNRFMKER
ncbi:nuclear transport factor 2 family protein [Marivirga sp. S37H4]|uniref:Nuclear transport factor 2 family protein n=1 Tax=Marivirga aurantiaca TaxID=2802615 RepID=A0A935C8Z1_9BACT|nr:nuclear transport factor 2 family protein [Marivirga aurantiaca]MBK6263968.1 nuclear transport factor 2 family protein [Marivirga aurantiaca]